LRRSVEEAIDTELRLGANVDFSVDHGRHGEFHSCAGIVAREILVTGIQQVGNLRACGCFFVDTPSVTSSPCFSPDQRAGKREFCLLQARGKWGEAQYSKPVKRNVIAT